MNQKLHALNCGESSFVTSRWVKCLFPLALLLTTGSVYGQAAAQPSPPIVVRDSDKVVLAHKETVSFVGSEWKLDFYRNLGYNAGLSGNCTFLVAEPLDNPGAEAPLWVYLHGGGIGYFDEQGVYHATGNQTQDTWNHEETFEDLRKIGLRPIIDKNGQPIDNTVTRRIKEGYRLLVVSMSDHDLYLGLGTPYPNNPKGGEVNGLQATMAAIDYTVANYPTTHVFAHGTSAGGLGVWGLAVGFAAEGKPLTGVVSDSGLSTPRSRLIFAAFSGAPRYPYAADFNLDGVVNKIGAFADHRSQFHPEAQVSAGFDDVPVLFIGGKADPRALGGNQPPIAEAAAAGLNNVDWVYDGIRQAVADQPDSPHKVSVIDGAGHSPTNKPGVANDIVDDFISQVLLADPPHPFRAGRTALEAPPRSASAAPNLIEQENAKPGTRDWILTKTHVGTGKDWYRSRGIEGYCSEMSVRVGDTIKVMVSTNPVSEFDLEIFRTGYYGGTGGRSMMKFESIQGKTQADPPIGENRLRECTWEPSVQFEIPGDWLSGVYLGKLTAKREGVQSYIIFTVRDDRPCDLLFQSSVLTWQAYNSWPNQEWSLYHDNTNNYRDTGKNNKTNGKKIGSIGPDTGWVSFDRPFAQFRYDHFVDRPDTVGSGEFLLWEFPLSYWMEQQGYDVSYITNVDTHCDGQGLLRAKGFLSVGHDSFWTRDMYSNVSAARDEGVNLAFVTGSAAWCVVPLLPSSEGQPHRIIRRESAFLGEELGRIFNEYLGFKYPPGPDGALLIGGRHGKDKSGAGDWVCAKPEHWFYEGTGMKEGDTVKGIVGWHWHGDPARELPGFDILAATAPLNNKGKPHSPHVATIYDGPKGNVVVNVGCVWWSQAMSSPPGHVLPVHSYAHYANKLEGPDPRVQRMMKNMLNRFVEEEI